PGFQVSSQTEQACSAVFRRAQIRKPLRAAKNNWWNARERLGIIDDGRSCPESHDSRERRPNARHSALAFERFHQRRFLANFVCAGTAMPVNVEVVPRPEDVLAEKALRIRIGDGL